MYVRDPKGSSGKKKEPKPKLFGPDIFGWGGGLPREGVGAKKFGMSFETQGNQTFWRDIPGFCRGFLGAPEKFEKKVCVQSSTRKVLEKLSREKVCVDFLSPKASSRSERGMSSGRLTVHAAGSSFLQIASISCSRTQLKFCQNRAQKRGRELTVSLNCSHLICGRVSQLKNGRTQKSRKLHGK